VEADQAGQPIPYQDNPGRTALEWLERFVTALELSPAVAVHSQDRDGTVRFWNHSSAELYRSPVTESVGQAYLSIVVHIARAEFLSMLEAIWTTGRPSSPRDWEVELRDGTRRWLHSSHFPVLRDGTVQQVFCMELDITARKQIEHGLLRTARVFENCRDAILIMDPDYRVVSVNQAFSDIAGFATDEVVGQILPSLRFGLHDTGFYEQILDRVRADGHWEGELTSVRSDGEEYPAWVAVTAIRDGSGAISNYMAILADITERKRAEQAARHLAEHDPLTGLPNRVLFLDRLHQALAGNRRQHNQFALLFLDLDRFKQINDTLGHSAGDAVLQEVARRLTHCVRAVDTVSRLGGDEFVVLLADIGGVDQAAHVAGTVMQQLSLPVELESQQSVTPSVSIGIAICPDDGHTAETLLHHADVAMYHAKQDGRNAFRFFSPEMNAHVVERVQMENMLRRALANGEFALEYQPEIDIQSGRTIGVEALIRWRHPERGLLLPHQFIPVAEESGLIVPIGEWVLRQACDQARAWRDQGYPVVVAVNLSGAQFIHPNLVRVIDDALASSGLEARFLDLEITESVIMNGDAITGATVQALRERGVQLTIDDFGTGYSSLSCLRRFPLSKLKIDRSFVEDITRAPHDAAMIPAIIAVARSLKLKVIAEGVENAEQLQFLQDHGCDEYQGHYASNNRHPDAPLGSATSDGPSISMPPDRHPRDGDGPISQH
jgi:diguanylate cyclase (GGDEF)-like protein/PAS domain S-box-containing protein